MTDPSAGPSSEFAVAYVKSRPGILKIVEIALSLITFICAVIVGGGGFGWVCFVSITAFILSTVSFILHILNVTQIQENIAVLVEAIVWAVYCLFFLIAGIVAAVGAGILAPFHLYGSSSGAAAFFAFACLVVWVIDTVFQFLDWNARRGGTTTVIQTTTTTVTVDSTQPGANY